MTGDIPDSAPARRYAYEWYVVLVCMLAYIFSFVDRQILALMIEPIKRDLGLSDTQFSLLHGLAFSLFYAFMGIPIALLADRYSRPRIIAIGVAFWSLATAVCGLSRNFAQMFLARIGVGVGEAALSPATYSMLSDMFPRDRLGRAVGVYSIGSFIGGGLAFLIGGYVINLLKRVDTVVLPLLGALRPWQVTFFVVGLPGLLVALLILLTVRDPGRRGLRLGADGRASKPSIGDTFRFLARHRRTFCCHFLGFSFYAMALFALLGWTPAFYMRKFGLSPTEAGYMLGAVVLAANTAGVFCGGWLMDALARRGRRRAVAGRRDRRRLHGGAGGGVHAGRFAVAVGGAAVAGHVLRVLSHAHVDGGDADPAAQPAARAGLGAVPADLQPDRAGPGHHGGGLADRPLVPRSGGGGAVAVRADRRGGGRLRGPAGDGLRQLPAQPGRRGDARRGRASDGATPLTARPASTA